MVSFVNYQRPSYDSKLADEMFFCLVLPNVILIKLIGSFARPVKKR